MTHDMDLALIHAEIDGELGAAERGELARRVLADPQTRAAREELRQLCTALEGVPAVDPPAGLETRIFAVLPASHAEPRRFALPPTRWRYAAVVAGVLALGAVVFATLDGQRTGSAELAGTITASRSPVTIDAVRLDGGPITGRVSLYRDARGLGLAFDLATNLPVSVIIASGGHTLRVDALNHEGGAGAPTEIALAGFDTKGPQTVDVRFLSSGREIRSATLRVPAEH
jgi:hypothetical protein